MFRSSEKLRMAEEKYTQDYVKMSLADAQGAAKAAKNMADRRFKRFEGDRGDRRGKVLDCQVTQERH